MKAIATRFPEPARLGNLRIRPFEVHRAASVASWIRSDEELFHLAPSTIAPLTAGKVVGWTRGHGHALSLCLDEAAVGYAELNPMADDPDHYWLGHVIIDPEQRGSGLGSHFVRALLAHAFDTLAARRVSLVVFPDNVAAVRCYHSAGMRRTGFERHRFGMLRRFHRLARFECLPEQFVRL